jgi:hypothetical protein
MTTTGNPAPSRFPALPVFVGASVIALLAGIAGALTLSHGDLELLNWSFTHWAFSYDHGIVKRSIVGEVVSHLASGRELRAVTHTLSLVVAVLVAVAIVWLCSRPYLRYRTQGTLVFALLACTHFATLQHFFYDLGRMDAIGFLIMLLGIVSIERLPRVAVAPTVFVLCVLGIFVHEAFLVINVPLLLMYWAVRDAPGRWYASQLLVGVLLVVVAVFVMTRGPAIGRDEYLLALRAAHGDWINAGSVGVLYAGVAVEAPRALALLVDKHRLFQYGVLGIALIPMLLLFWRATRAVAVAGPSGPDRARLFLWMVSALGPLGLYVIGIDFARWWALALTNLILVVALAMTFRDDVRLRVETVLTTHPLLVWIALGVNLLVGPLGVASSAFPRLQPYLMSGIGTLIDWLRT